VSNCNRVQVKATPVSLQQHDFEEVPKRDAKPRTGCIVTPASNGRGGCQWRRRAGIGSDHLSQSRCWVQRIITAIQTKPGKHPEYRIADNNLYRYFHEQYSTEEDEPHGSSVSPKYYETQVFKECHSADIAGHLGIAKTYQKYYWPGMFRQAANHVRCCQNCRKYKPDQRATAGKMYHSPVKEPNTVVAIDLIEPLLRSSNGRTWILVC